MKYFIGVIILVLVYGLFTYGRIVYIARHSKNPEIKQESSELGQGPPLRYIAAGDSTAVGIGASSVKDTYPYKVAQTLSANLTVSYSNVAVSGAKTEDVLIKQLPKIIQSSPDVVTISIGANSATHLRSVQSIIADYRNIIAALTEKTHAQIYITNIANFTGARLLPWWYVSLLEYRSKKINSQIGELETDRVKIINIHDFGWDKYPDRQITYSFDHFHPSDIGYQNWTNAFVEKITSKQ